MTAVYETIYKTTVSPGGRSLFVKIRPRDCVPVNNSGRSFIERLIDAIWSDLDSFLRLVLVSTTTISVIDPIVLYTLRVRSSNDVSRDSSLSSSTLRFSFSSSFYFSYSVVFASNLLHLAQFIINIEKKKEII